MDMTEHPIKNLYEGVSNFYKGNVVSSALKRGLYHGNLVLYGPGDLIEEWVFERYPEEFANMRDKWSGEKGYDDPGRLTYALKKMSLFREKSGNDKDGAIAISDADDGYRIMRAGGFIRVPTVYDEKIKDFMTKASEYKRGKVNGRHISGFNFSRLTDDATGAVIASAGGSDIVTAIGDDVVPEFSEHVDRYGFFGKLKNMWNRYVGSGEE